MFVAVSRFSPIGLRRPDESDRLTPVAAYQSWKWQDPLVAAAGPDTCWIVPATTALEIEAARRAGGRARVYRLDGRDYRVRFVTVDPDAAAAHARIFDVFLDAHNYRLGPGIARLPGGTLADFEGGYRGVNRELAAAVIDEVFDAPAPIVLLDEPTFYGAGTLIRQHRADAVIHHFIGFPWPQPDIWRVLPRSLRNAPIDAVHAADHVRVHSPRWARNILDCCRELGGLDVDYGRERVRARDGRDIQVQGVPTPNAMTYLDQLAEQHVDAQRRELRQQAAGRAIVAVVAREDEFKNVTGTLRAFDRVLADHPEHRGRTCLLVHLIADSVSTKPALRKQVHELVGHINSHHGAGAVHLRVADDMGWAVAEFLEYDVLDVASFAEGYCRVAAEGPALNQRHGVLVLSENAGVASILGGHALTFNPYDDHEHATALNRALSMPAGERQQGAQELRRIARHGTLEQWFSDWIGPTRPHADRSAT